MTTDKGRAAILTNRRIKHTKSRTRMPTSTTLGKESPRSFSGLYKRARIWPFTTKMHLWMQQVFVYSLYWCGAFWWAKRSLRKNGSVVVLTFHRVLRDSAFENSTVLRGVVVRENTFRELAGHISKYYEAIKIDETLPGNPSDRLRVAFTFDDGWTDNYAVAFPIAKRFRIPLTIFVCPGLIDSEEPFWPERMASLSSKAGGALAKREIDEMIETLKKYSPEERDEAIKELLKSNGVEPSEPGSLREKWTLSWEEILEMDRLDVSFGSHTQTHQILTTLPSNRIQTEIRLSKAALEHVLGAPCDIFAYPNGNWDPAIRDLVAREGFKLAFTTERGAWTPTCDPLSIPRANVYEGNVVRANGKFSPAMFEYTSFWKVWLAMKKRKSLNHQPQSTVGKVRTSAKSSCEEPALPACQD